MVPVAIRDGSRGRSRYVLYSLLQETLFIRRTGDASFVESIEFLPLVKAYPALSRTYGEVSCIAGVQIDGPRAPHWIRLYPDPFRALDDAQQFHKYQPMRLEVESHARDRRPETRRPNRDSIELLGDTLPTTKAWEQRRPYVEPLMMPSMCEIQRRQRTDGTSLGVFRPREVLDLRIEPADVSKEKEQIARAWAAQPSLLDGLGSEERSHQTKALEIIPWTFKYRYRCQEAGCKTHTQSIIDWEIAEFFRRERVRNDWKERLRAKWVGQLCAADRDTAFFVGNQHQHPGSFLVLGVWWPEARPEQLTLGAL